MLNSLNQRNQQYDQLKQNLQTMQGKNEIDIKEEDVPPIIQHFIKNGDLDEKRKIIQEQEELIHHFTNITEEKRRQFEKFYRDTLYILLMTPPL